jgi:hypothetical protein
MAARRGLAHNRFGRIRDRAMPRELCQRRATRPAFVK